MSDYTIFKLPNFPGHFDQTCQDIFCDLNYYLNFGSVLISLSAGMSLRTDLKASCKALALSFLWNPSCQGGVMNLLHSYRMCHGVNFFNIFCAHFTPIFWSQKITKPNITREKLLNSLSYFILHIKR